MKNWIAYILAFYILISAVLPCSLIDNCEDAETPAQTTSTNNEADCSNCSPFSICASCPGFTVIALYTAVLPAAIASAPAYSVYHFSPKSEYHATLFQPPRAA